MEHENTAHIANPLLRFMKDYIYTILALLLVFFIFQFIFQIGVIASGSMEPTCMTGDIFIANRIFDVDNIQRGDIISFKHSPANVNEVWVKRVVGLPGETICFENGLVYIEVELLDESEYLETDIETTASAEVFVIPDDAFFVMGDNRLYSYDSRYLSDPYISKEDVVSTQVRSVSIPFLKRILTFIGICN